jgi:hypothetical protein
VTLATITSPAPISIMLPVSAEAPAMVAADAEPPIAKRTVAAASRCFTK